MLLFGITHLALLSYSRSRPDLQLSQVGCRQNSMCAGSHFSLSVLLLLLCFTITLRICQRIFKQRVGRKYACRRHSMVLNAILLLQW